MDQTSSDTTPAVSLAEGAASESIDIGDAIIEDETHILPLIKDYRSILYLATDEGGDIAYGKQGFKGLEDIARPGHCMVQHAPIHLDPPLSTAEADYALDILHELPRPTYIMCKSGRRASAIKALYLAEAAGFGADDINDNEDQMKKVEGVELGGPWLKDEKMRAWVRQVLMASEKGNKWREKDKEMVMEGMKAQKHTRVEEEDDVEKE